MIHRHFKNAKMASDVKSCLKQAVDKFRAVFGPDEEPTIGVFAPGRVNLIGEHTDYNGGCVLPMALHLVTVIVGRPSPQSATCRVATCATSSDITDQNSYQEFPLPPYPPAEPWIVPQDGPQWVTYVKGVVALMNKEGKVPPFDAVISTSIPLGGGVSSSAAMEVATCFFVEKLTPGRFLKPQEKALLCQEAEHRYAHMPCGIMDQFVSVMAKEKCALFLDCSTQTTQDVPLFDPALVVLVTNSNFKHTLVDGEYKYRRDTCMDAARKLGKELLKDVSLEELENSKDQLTPDEFKFSRHVITEIQRTKEAVEALNSKDYWRFGQLMNDSHISLRDDFRVSCDELDRLVTLALEGKEGVYGSRMTGGGFGGCTVTLLHRTAVELTIHRIKTNYRSRDGAPATFFVVTPSAGAGVVSQKQLQKTIGTLAQL